MKPIPSHSRWRWGRRITALAFLALLWLGRSGEWPWFRGTTAATQTKQVLPLADPLAAVEVSLASHTWPTTLWIGAGILILVAVLLGPIFCGWVCPLGFGMDLVQVLRRFTQKHVLRKHAKWPDWSLPRGTRTAVLAGVLVFALVAQVPLFQALSPIHMVARALVFTVDGALLVVLALLLIEFVAPRLWCRSICPLGELYSRLGRLALLRVRIDPTRAGQLRCRKCDIACPMGIRVMEEHTLVGHSSITDPACNRCGACIDTCPNSVLFLGLRGRHKKGETLPPSPCDTCELHGHLGAPSEGGRHTPQA
ncbi:MAG: 4Fe-4S binding protein [Planctomycetota bacterium]